MGLILEIAVFTWSIGRVSPGFGEELHMTNKFTPQQPRDIVGYRCAWCDSCRMDGGPPLSWQVRNTPIALNSIMITRYDEVK